MFSVRHQALSWVSLFLYLQPLVAGLPADAQLGTDHIRVDIRFLGRQHELGP